MRYGSLIVALTLLLSAVPGGVVSETNEPPVVDAGLDQSVERGEAVFLDAGGSFDPDGEFVTYNWTVETPDGSTLTPHDSEAERTSFEATQEGRYEVTLTVTDDAGSSSSDTLYVDVAGAEGDTGTETEPNETNQPPTGVIAGPDSVVRGTSAPFSADVYDPDGDIAAYTWSIDGGGREVERTFTEPVGSRVTLSVRITDDDGATTRLTKSVTVVSGSDGGASENAPPTADIEGPSRVGVGESATFLLSTSDSDGTVVRRSWTSPVSGTGPTLTHSFDASGTYSITARVTDDDGATATATHSVEVYGSGGPVVSISGPETAPAGSTRTYTLDAYDPDGGELTISWDPAQTQLERGATRFENVVTMEAPPGGTESVSATVTDDEGNSVTVVKETKVTSVTGDVSRISDSLVISEIRAYYSTDDRVQESNSDTIESGVYTFEADVATTGSEEVIVKWKIDDGTSAVDSLGSYNGTATSTIEHQFMADNGTSRTISLVVEATNSNGHQTRKRWEGRVQTVIAHSNASLAASFDGRTVPSSGTLQVPAGATVKFHAFSNQQFRMEFGDGSAKQYPRSPDPQSFTHTYEIPGNYTIQFTSIQGDDGFATKRLTINVVENSYSEYWYDVEVDSFERTISANHPLGEGWSKLRIDHAERYFTGNTLVYTNGAGFELEFGDEWVITDTYTEKRAFTSTVIRENDPDGTGEHWVRTNPRVQKETRTTYEDQYEWFDEQYDVPGWSTTGESRTREVIIGDGHDHDRTRHTDRERTSCADWRLDPSPYGGFDKVCKDWNYETRVWYTGHDHDGYSTYETEYHYHREVQQSKKVWLHEYSQTTYKNVEVTEVSETASRNFWLWERTSQDSYKTKYSLNKPTEGSFVEGTLRIVNVRCNSDKSHFDSVKC